MEKKRLPGYLVHIIIAVSLLLIVAVVILRLNIWSHRSTTVVHTSNPEEFSSESQDYVFFRTPDQPVREPDGVTRAVVLGNYMVSNYDKEKSVINILRERLDWEFTDLSIDSSIITRKAPVGEERTEEDEFCLYSMVESLIARHLSDRQKRPFFFGDRNVDEFVARWKDTDLSKVDYVIIMYALNDYYADVRRQGENEQGENDENTFFGSLYKSIIWLKTVYPHLQIVVVSGYPTYVDRGNGEIEYSYSTDYGQGTMSQFAQLEIFAALNTDASYVDCFYCGINEDTINTYVDNLSLTDAGMDLVGGHIADVLSQLVIETDGQK